MVVVDDGHVEKFDVKGQINQVDWQESTDEEDKHKSDIFQASN